MSRIHTFFLLILCLLLAVPAQAELHMVDSPDAMPETDADGFLSGSEDGYGYKNHSEGLWLYVDANHRIEITRHQTKTPLITYYLADIVCRPGTTVYTRSWNEKKPGRTNGLPQDIALRDHVVFAMSGDFYSYRIAHDRYPGIIIRDGKAIYKKTYSKYVRAVPNLANIAFFPSGMTEVHECSDYSAKEYLERGAETVLSFGPVLIRDGEIPKLSDDAYTHLEPRCAIGVVERSHFIALLVEGRKVHSDGADLQSCAEILLEAGCTDALNLDGGNTAAMLFLGESVQLTDQGGIDVNDRSIPDILCVGSY